MYSHKLQCPAPVGHHPRLDNGRRQEQEEHTHTQVESQKQGVMYCIYIFVYIHIMCAYGKQIATDLCLPLPTSCPVSGPSWAAATTVGTACPKTESPQLASQAKGAAKGGLRRDFLRVANELKNIVRLSFSVHSLSFDFFVGAGSANTVPRLLLGKNAEVFVYA